MLLIWIQYLWCEWCHIIGINDFLSFSFIEMFCIISLIRCMYCILTVGPDALLAGKKTSVMKRIQRQMIDCRSILLEGDKDDSCREAVCFIGAVIETGACLMFWLCYEFTDSMTEISGLHYDLHHQKKKKNPPHPSKEKPREAAVSLCQSR